MSITVNCKGCEGILTVPDNLLGRTIRCKTCGQLLRVGDAKLVEDEPRPSRNRRRSDDEDDERPRRRPARHHGVPVWVWVAAGAVAVLVVGVALVLALRGGKGDGTGDGPPRGWVRRSPEGTKLTFDMPTEPAFDGGGIGDTNQFGDRLYVCQQSRSGTNRPVTFSAIISFHAAHDQAKPNAALANLAKQKLPVGTGDRWNRLVKQYQIQGRDALVYQSEAAEKMVLLVFEPGQTYLFEVTGPGVTETDADVKQFFDSVRFAD